MIELILRDCSRITQYSVTCIMFNCAKAYIPRWFLPLDALSAKGGIAIVTRPSVCLSDCNVEVLWSCGRRGWVTSKVNT